METCFPDVWGEYVHVLNVPRHPHHHIAADVEDATRIKPQTLIVLSVFHVYPRVPSNQIRVDAATAERIVHIWEAHIEVTSDEVDLELCDKPRQSIPKLLQHFWPCTFHCEEEAMDTAYNHRLS